MRRAIAARSPQTLARARYGIPLRGRPAQAFASLAGFAAALFLVAGTYLVLHALMNPVEADASSLITGACAVALGAILLLHLWPPRRVGRRHREAH